MRTFITLTIGAVTIAVLTTSVASAQRYTIPELAAASSEKTLEIPWHEEERVLSLDELTSKADVVLEARLVQPNSYLSEDQKRIYTDFQIVPSHMVRSQIGDILSSRTPGPRQSLRLTVPGGRLTIGDKTIISPMISWRSLRSGGRYLIFLARVSQSETRFVPVGGSAGVFEVMEMRVP